MKDLPVGKLSGRSEVIYIFLTLRYSVPVHTGINQELILLSDRELLVFHQSQKSPCIVSEI